MAAVRGDPIHSVLDLGCGTGILAAKLAVRRSPGGGAGHQPDMLAKAGVRCGGLTDVQLVEGDFRHLRLDRQFDAVVSGFNTLNYVSGETS